MIEVGRLPPPPVGRLVALGASNLTRGFRTIVSTARIVWGPDVEVMAALGHGRSYGAPSRVIARTLPGILQSGIWPVLKARPPVRTRALITDVGNDLLYGFSPGQTLAWVEEVVDRLQLLTDDIVITDLPLATVKGLSPARFIFFRTLLFPGCRLTLAEVADAAGRVSEGLARLAESRHLVLASARQDWYRFDPVHIRPSRWQAAWQEILGAQASLPRGARACLEGARLYLMRPEQEWLFGIERLTRQEGVRLSAGGRVWLF